MDEFLAIISDVLTFIFSVNMFVSIAIMLKMWNEAVIHEPQGKSARWSIGMMFFPPLVYYYALSRPVPKTWKYIAGVSSIIWVIFIGFYFFFIQHLYEQFSYYNEPLPLPTKR